MAARRSASSRADEIRSATKGSNDALAIALDGLQTREDEIRALYGQNREGLKLLSDAHNAVVLLNARIAALEFELARERNRDKSNEVELKRIELVDKHLAGAVAHVAPLIPQIVEWLRGADNKDPIAVASMALFRALTPELRGQMSLAAPNEFAALASVLRGGRPAQPQNHIAEEKPCSSPPS